ncbi:MAG: DNA-binding protein [Cytophagales bacterium CG12_big_fil_rev_8_21_14_0_65_40_12]|nr:MAG: DNA-binding protein [Cytophagales bacterium CG12_big_fil_rev_8_21_14_0_65_40_12]PIW05507.1 MAG: DNA-binding protein [Cytophagales bacterium CG17_big_fil_post_rev_8_21_14_2_50_40_13]
MAKNKVIIVKGVEIAILQKDTSDFISLTDMVKGFGDDTMIYSWMRNRNTLEFLGIWEEMNNPDFKGNEFVTFKTQAGLNSFNLTPKKWINATNAIGIISKAGRYGGGTFAHKDLAFEFGSWLSPEFKLYLIKEFQRLKEDENDRLNLTWNLHRTLSKINYRIHTDAIKEHIIPNTITREQANLIYSNEADVLNVALFGKTARQWRDENPNTEGNIRDHATIEQLLVLANIESMNAEFIKMNLVQSERLLKLNQIAISQLKSIVGNAQIKKLK